MFSNKIDLTLTIYPCTTGNSEIEKDLYERYAKESHNTLSA